MAVVEIQRLSKSYGNAPPALTDLSFEIGEGMTGLLGPNGAGKSTLIQCVLGLLPDYEGSVRVLGLDASTERRAIRRRVGFMPELDVRLEGMTGIRAVRFLGQLTGMRRRHALRRAHEVLYHVGLGEAVYRQVTEYSTGMRQRFKLAQALVHDPALLFLDEPLSGLDPGGRDELLALIRELAREHDKHVVWSSHILPEVQKAVDNVVVLDKGRFLGRFGLAELLVDEGRFAVETEGPIDGLRERLEAIGGVVEAAKRGGERADADAPATSRTAWIVRLPADMGVDEILSAGASAGVRLRKVKPKADGLDEIFPRLLAQGAGA